MAQYIDKSALVAEIEKWRDGIKKGIFSIPLTGSDKAYATFEYEILGKIKDFLDTLEVKDHYEQCIQYDSIKAGIKAHAETYSFNIESELFNQLTKEQQKLWRKEIEQACISGGEMGIELAKDTRYKENVEVKDVDLENEVESYWKQCDMTWCRDAYSMTHTRSMLSDIAKHFYELGLSVSNKIQKGE